MNKRSIHIIGGGIIGLCSAWYLSQEGYEVTILEKNNFTDSTSHGNAGMIVPSHFVPLASPGVIAKGIKWVFDRKSPFCIPPRWNIDLLSWLWHFYRFCNPKHVQGSMSILYELNEQSKNLYQEFATHPEFNFDFEKKGLLMLYQTAHQEKEEKNLAEKANDLGISANIVSPSDLKTLEPNLSLNALGGVYFPGDAHLYPNKFIRQLISNLQAKQVRLKTRKEVIGFDVTNSKITDLFCQDGERIKVQNLLITAGSWSPQILNKIGIKMLLQPGKGYSFTYENLSTKPHLPAILSEAKVAITPMGQDLRIGGTLELGEFSNKINSSRLKGIEESIPKYYPTLKLPEMLGQNTWVGYRPCTPDGLPYIGYSSKIKNLIAATGHGMMGMSMGPVTGKIVSQIISGQQPNFDLHLLRLDRF